MKLYQLMVEHTPEEENLDWTKIEPSVSLLKSPKGRFKSQESRFRIMFLPYLLVRKKKDVQHKDIKEQIKITLDF